MLGMQLGIDCKMVVAECLKRGMLTNSTGDNVLRCMPAMTVTKAEIDRATRIMDEVLGAIARAGR